MEERIIDDPRKIKVKKNAVGGIEDATDDLAPAPEAEEEEEYEIELPEQEFDDEDLIGLAPSELKKALEKKQREAEEARAERDRLLAEGERALSAGDFEHAEPFFEQALVYDEGCLAAEKGVWTCRTRGLKQPELIVNRTAAEELSESGDEVRAFVLSAVGGALEAERAAAEAEAKPLREKVEKGQEERRSAFLANRNYYLVPFLVFVAAFVLFAAAAGVSAAFIVRTQSALPLILTAVFGGIAVLSLVPFFLYSRKLVVAQRLVRENEKLSSTEDGARLARLEEQLECLSLILG